MSGSNTKRIRLVFTVLSVLFLAYSYWVYTFGTKCDVSMNEQAKSGKLLWQKFNCTACHQIYGLGGYLGPDLTNVVSIKGEEYVRAMMRSAKNQMPVFDMTEEESADITEFLKYIDRTGAFPDTNVRFTWYGSYKPARGYD